MKVTDHLLGGQSKFFFGLTPDRVLEAVESAGLRCTGRCFTLNSFENRVYDVELEPESADSDGSTQAPAASKKNFRIVKFYRPGRWTREQILEEHEFLLDLQNTEIPAVAPLFFSTGETLREVPGQGIWYTLFPKVGGRAPDELSDEQLERIGRLLARIHNVGAVKKATHRVRIDPDTYGLRNLEFLLQGNFLPLEFKDRYEKAVKRICEITAPWFAEASYQRIHGDCHLGNLLWSPAGPFFLDFDDMVIGPPVQDVWLIVPGRDSESIQQREVLISAYEQMRAFDRKSLRLIEPLRVLRIVHFSAWIARRWEDPAFPGAFPNFGSDRYWRDETVGLEDQLRVLEGAVE
ncbi:MAG: serine/threonine protein kinase [Bdellovibrionota bacterium]